MNGEKVEFWTYGSENGNIVIYFDGQKRFIEVSPKDVECMMSWLLMDKGTYRLYWSKGLI